MLESAIVKYRSLLVSCSVGTPCEVKFDWDTIWDFRKRKGKGFIPEELRFYHVHPSGCLSYSDTDLNCIKGFNIAFNHPMLFSIVCFKNSVIGDLEHVMKTYRYVDGMQTEKASRLRYVDLQILKELSYVGKNRNR